MRQPAIRAFLLQFDCIIDCVREGLSPQYGSYQRMRVRHSDCDSSMFWSRIAHQTHILKAKMNA
jgi:hypothetical protein